MLNLLHYVCICHFEKKGTKCSVSLKKRIAKITNCRELPLLYVYLNTSVVGDTLKMSKNVFRTKFSAIRIMNDFVETVQMSNLSHHNVLHKNKQFIIFDQILLLNLHPKGRIMYNN